MVLLHAHRTMRISALIACWDSGSELTDNSMSGMTSISGMARSSSASPMSRSMSMSMSAFIVNRQANDSGEMSQVVLKPEVEN